MKSLSIEGSSIGIQVFTITPGMFMNTPMSEQNYTDEYKKKWVDPFKSGPESMEKYKLLKNEISVILKKGGEEERYSLVLLVDPKVTKNIKEAIIQFVFFKK